MFLNYNYMGGIFPAGLEKILTCILHAIDAEYGRNQVQVPCEEHPQVTCLIPFYSSTLATSFSFLFDIFLPGVPDPGCSLQQGCAY